MLTLAQVRLKIVMWAALGALVLCPTAPAKVRVTKVDAAAKQRDAGASITVKGTATNRGRRTASASLRVTMRNGDRAYTLGSGRVRAIGAGKKKRFTLKARVPKAAVAGSYRVRVCVRAGKESVRCGRSSRLTKIRVPSKPVPNPAPAPFVPPVFMTPPAPPAPEPEPGPVELGAPLSDAVTINNVNRHLIALQRLADRNGGSRASGEAGYTESATYVETQLTGAGYTVTRQTVQVPYFRVNSAPLFTQVTPTPTAYTDFALAEYSGPGDVTGAVVPVDIVLPPTPTANGNSSGCEAADFAGVDVAGKIALLQRGTCALGVKALNAAAAGAIAVIIFNEGQPGRTDVFEGTLDAPAPIPVILTSLATGQALLSAGVTARVKADTLSEYLPADTLMAETPGGAASDVTMLGAHLDSRPGSPGINDNATGVAVALEIARQLAALGDDPVRKARFAFWAGGERRAVGSSEYLSGLPQSQIDAIDAYLDLDTIGSPNGVQGITTPNGDTGTALATALEDWFTGQERPVITLDPVQVPDRNAFLANGIGSVGLFTGTTQIKTPEQAALFGGVAGTALDACWHKACDNLGNVSRDLLESNAKAAAYVFGSRISSAD